MVGAVVEVAVLALERKQLGVRALLAHAAVVKHDDAIGVLDGGQAVRDDDGGAPDGGAVHGGLYKLLALSVEGAGGLCD